MIRRFGNIFFLLFCSAVLLLCVKGISGSPTSKEVNNPEWSKFGPLEPSIEGGRFALTYSMVENHSFVFDKDIALLATPDLGYRNGKYVSLFAPGVSIASIPGYVIGKLLGISQVGTFATIALFALLNVYLIRKISILLGANPIAATIGSIAFIFASPAFAYATTLYQHHLSVLLMLSSIYLLLRYRNFKSLFAVWAIYAIAFIVDYPNLILMFPIAVYALIRAFSLKKTNYSFNVSISPFRLLATAGVILPLIFLFWYNQNVNGGFMKLSGTLDRVASISIDGKPTLESELIKKALKNDPAINQQTLSFFSPFKSRSMINGLYVHLFSPDRGILYFTPIMFFAIPGLIFALKRKDNRIVLLFSIILTNLLLYSMWDDPNGGWAFGSRYLIPAYALLSIFISFVITKYKNKDLFLFAFYVVLVYSIAVNTLGALTSHTNPPKAEALSLQRQYKKEQKYTYFRNVDLLNNGESKSYIFQAFASNHISAWDYYRDIASLIIIISGFLLVFYKADVSYQENQFGNKNAIDYDYEEKPSLALTFEIPRTRIQNVFEYVEKHAVSFLSAALSFISIACFVYYYGNGLGLAYNDARSHLDIGRRVVENLKPGFAQLGSVWLPFTHLLMGLTIWNNFMWHSGLSGALISMISFISTGVLIYMFLRKLGVNQIGRISGVLVFALNLNILYMQSTAMTELPLIAAMMASIYELVCWHEDEAIFSLVKCAFWVMIATLIRYDGWFLFVTAGSIIFYHSLRKHGLKTAEGRLIIFATLGGFGMFLWFLWNLLIFKDPLFFAFGSFSANAQQQVIAQSGSLITKNNIIYSTISYIYAIVYNSDIVTVILSVCGAAFMYFDKRIQKPVRIALLTLLSPLVFNIIALYFGHSVLFVQGMGANSWFNVRYGLLMVPAIAVYVGYLVNRLNAQKVLLLSVLVFVTFFTVVNQEVVTLEDAMVGLGGKNVTQVSDYLKDYASNTDGYILLSAAKHDAIIFTSGLPMTRFIHEGTGAYWDLATAHPERWARWIVLRTNDKNDLTTKLLKRNKAFKNDYTLVRKYPFADLYELKPQYIGGLQTKPKLADLK